MEDVTDRTVTVGDWMLTYLLMCIPVVNVIMIFVWAFGGNVAPSKANWAKASLIWMLIGVGFFFMVFFLAFMGAATAPRMQ